MKPFFCIDVTEDKKNTTYNGAEFITQSSSEKSKEELEEKQADAIELIGKSQYPLPVRIFKFICGIAAAILGISLCRGMIEVGIRKAYENAGVLFWIFGVCLVVWVILALLSRMKSKEVLETSKARNVAEDLDRQIEDMYAGLNIPESAEEVDVLMFRYVIKKGKISAKGTALSFTPYINIGVKAFISDNCLCLADINDVYSIPLSELKKITTVNKKISVSDWNKEEPFNKGKYKEYKMTANQYGCIFFKPYYILKLEHNGETWGIYFPTYELPAFEKLTGLKAEPQQN